MKSLTIFLLAAVSFCTNTIAQTTEILLKPCKVKINNQMFNTPPVLKFYKGMQYDITLFGENMDLLYLFNNEETGKQESTAMITEMLGKKGLTLDPCDSYTKDRIIFKTAYQGTGELFYGGRIAPPFGKLIKYNLKIAEILNNPVFSGVSILKGGQPITKPVAGTEYSVRIKGTSLSNVELLTSGNLLLRNVMLSDTVINGLITFEYSQQTTVNRIGYRRTPFYGMAQLFEGQIDIAPLTILPRPTVFDGNNLDWTWGPFFGERGTFFADVTGDGKADAVAINNSNVFVRRSNGNDFQPNESWTTNPYYGERGTYFKDVTGDGKADAIVVNNAGIVVRRSTGNRFSDNENWTSNAFFGERGTFFADVTGDGRADAIVVNNANIVVRPSNGSSFGEQQIWTTGAFYGERVTEFADVDGDGKADVIAVNNGGIVIKKSVGNRFGPNETFTSNAYFGTRGTVVVDVTGDRKADAIVINDDKITVRRSTGTAFSPNEDGTNQAFYGQRGTAFADIYGLGKAAVIVVNNETVYARRPN